MGTARTQCLPNDTQSPDSDHQQTDFVQTLLKRAKSLHIGIGPPWVEESDHRHRLLLRSRRERPRDRAAEQRDEIAAGLLIRSPRRQRLAVSVAR
jgi:hypothetical protein